MKTLNYFIWSNWSTEQIISDINTQQPDVINFFCAEEWEVKPKWRSLPNFEIIDNFSKFHELNLIFGSHKNKQTLKRTDYPIGANIYFWENYWTSFTRTNLEDANNLTISNNKNIKILFLSMNNQPHTHRCFMIDQLAKRNLIDTNAITWHYPDVDYNWKYWTPSRLVLDNSYIKNVDSYKSLPVELETSFMSLIAESTMNVPFITEKTWTAIFLKKPFLMYNARGAHQKLKEMGFLEYTEAFDYTFDSIKNDETRCLMILDNVESIIGKNYDNLRKQLLPKIEYNYNLAIKISKDTSMMPPPVKKHYELLKMDNGNLGGSHWLEMFR